ncbi:hypothetical protein [Bradyrhizobium sp. JYMT SZCCT0428]|uniref:hypothetical protein n=1 Tax=Bradyrhizobium sp. JYMT SZCCT0428 TaxID=2807673 RepID=UPI001BA81A1A|nr:hypothetical protein [Bradyrhizobium sp. JYMT SZCCT0428]MBR1149058.1 hypothetical protein [Bradyrhizobium sp. JYMT SZCCT0428]
MDANDIDSALHDIGIMVEFQIRSTQNLLGAGEGKPFQIPAEDANLLVFATLDVARRVKALQEDICRDE